MVCIKLPSEFKMKWLEALRSGDYEQGKNLLRSDVGYCCLGVACDINGAEWSLVDDEYYIENSLAYDFPKSGDLPDDVMKALKQQFIPGDRDTVMSALAKMNDSGHTFDEIALWIEENL